jgi:hypothetical protein
MDSELVHIFLIGVLVSVVGVYVAYLYGRNTLEFRWSEYSALLAAPTLVVLAQAYLLDIKILYLYVVSAVVGFVLEYSLGYTYHKVLNRKLWIYDSESYAVCGYTSWLTLPMWGIAGVLFWNLSVFVGL